MRDIKQLREKAKKAQELARSRSGGRRGGYSYTWVRMQDLEQKEKYVFRLLPNHPEKCPTGCRIYTQHTVVLDPLGEEKRKVLCTSSYGDAEDCYICNFVQAYVDGGVSNKVKPSVNEHVEMMFPSVSFLFPTVWWAEETEEERISRNNNPYKKRIIRPSNSNLLLAVFQVTWDSVMEQLEEIFSNYPEVNSQTRGRNLVLVRGRRDVVIRISSKETPFPDDSLLKKYPGIASFGEKKQLDYEQMEALLRSAWWWPHVSKHIDFEEEPEDEIGEIEIPF